jgi:hypothetical protein
MMLFDACPAAFGGLTRLSMQLRDLNFQDILAVCTRMEMLSLHTCDIGKGELRISYCFFGGVDLEWLPRLERFTYRSRVTTHDHPLLSFGHVPRLNTITLMISLLANEPSS